MTDNGIGIGAEYLETIFALSLGEPHLRQILARKPCSEEVNIWRYSINFSHIRDEKPAFEALAQYSLRGQDRHATRF